ncbi:PREDICTED: uncharacterized protein LOC108572604 [Habropoda laboriosa]|uniref:uncharacterized protein LOC108572604 n=1 Tax=Habropoda laboriosa TaxID=597456 RepID=UPI00083D5394|nr:PREDICTED: uncharacterized protein LOC108572604 [Habropoda laboriosa]
MSRRRRRANDFTDSLSKYTNSEIDSDTLYSISQDSLDDVKSKNSHVSTDTTCNSKHSIILASSSSKHSFAQNTFISSITSSSATQSAPDLNERINSFQAEHLSSKIDDNKENNGPQYSKKDKELDKNDMFTKLTTVPKKQVLDEHNKLNTNTINESSKRDSNYNIHNNKCNISSILEQNAPKITISQFISLPTSANEDKQICDTKCKDKNVSNEAKKFEILLCSLDNKFNQMKEVSQSQVLKRLSEKFIQAPQNFTEKLLTIIEESIINNDDNNVSNTSAINLSRLTTEFRKMCKFIEDESDPEWPPSPMSTPPCLQKIPTSPACNRSADIKTPKNEKLTSSISTSTPTTPISGIDIMKRRFFNKISRNNNNGNLDNICNESSNTSFEHLEAQCIRLFPEEKEYSKPLRKSLSMPSLLSMNQIQCICEQQMASLNMTNTEENHRENTIVTTTNLLDKCLCQSPSLNKSGLSCSKLQYHSKLKNIEYENMSYSKKKSRNLSGKSNFNKMKPEKFTNNYAAVDPDELEKTLLQGIAEKRKRCLDTARLLSEINKDPDVIEAQKTLKLSPIFSTDNESNSLSSDATKFLKTLMSCKDYQTYLEKQKPLFMSFQNSNPSTPEISLKNMKKSDLEHKTLNIKKTPCISHIVSPNRKPCNSYKSPLSKKRGEEKEKKGESIKSKLFVTPGKPPPNNDCPKQKVYFPTMHSPVENTAKYHILKSPHAKGLYRLNYNTIISPVGMYIKGTDMQLIKNVHAKKDRLLLTPTKENAKASPNRNSKQNTPTNSITISQEKMSLKINLSPKVHTNFTSKQKVLKTKTSDDHIPKSHFVLPKVSYKLPLHVKTINQDRTNTIQKRKCKGNVEEYEIHYEPEDESIHIEQTACKTNFIHRRENV